MADKIKAGIEIKAFDLVTAPLKKINASLESIRSPVRRLNNSFQALSAAAGLPQLKKSFLNVGNAVMGVGRELWRLGRNFMIFGGLAAAGLYRLIKGTSDAADKLAKLSIATGVSVEDLQTLGFAFEQEGGSAEGFQSAVGEFATKLGQARNGAGKMAAMLKRIDPVLLKTLKSATDTGEAFRAVFEGVARAKTDADRMALATAAFGASAAIPVVNLAKQGKEGLAELEEQMRRIGIISAEEAKNAEAMNDAWNTVKRSFQALKNTALAPLFPVLKDIADLISEWFIGKKDEVAKWGRDFAKDLPARLELIKKRLKELKDFLAPIGRALKWITEDGTRFKAVLGVLAVFIAGKLILAVALLTKALIGLGVTLLTTPIGWFLGIAAALAAIAYLIITNWESVKDMFVKLWDSPIGKFIRFMTPIGWLMNAAAGVIEHWEPVKKFFVDLWEYLTKLGDLVSNTRTFKMLAKAFNWATGGAFEQKPGEKKKQEKTVAEGVKKVIKEQPPEKEKVTSLGIETAMARVAARQGPSKVAMTVEFKNVPQGVRVNTKSDSNVDIQTDVAYLGGVMMSG